MKTWLQSLAGALRPPSLAVDARERWRALLGAGLGVLLTGAACRWLGPAGSSAAAWLVAPVGASAVLVFAVPASPLAQPWSVIGGTTLSVLAGALCAALVPDAVLAGGLAVALAIGLMFVTRSLHPPGGAAALLAALNAVDFSFALFPVLTNCVLLVAAGVAYNRLTGRPYPQGASSAPRATDRSSRPSRFSAADLDEALRHYNQVLDISRDQLETLLHHAESASYQRRFGDLRCGDVMSPAPVAVVYGTPLDEAWRLMRDRGVKALPVTDRAGHITGIVTVADFLRHAGLDRPEGIGQRLRGFVRPSGLVHSEKPEVVGQIMAREVRVVSVGRNASELIPLFSEAGHHHIPVIDPDRRLVGIITQSDLMRSLYRATEGAGPGGG